MKAILSIIYCFHIKARQKISCGSSFLIDPRCQLFSMWLQFTAILRYVRNIESVCGAGWLLSCTPYFSIICQLITLMHGHWHIADYGTTARIFLWKYSVYKIGICKEIFKTFPQYSINLEKGSFTILAKFKLKQSVPT